MSINYEGKNWSKDDDITYSDMNRIENAIALLANRGSGIGDITTDSATIQISTAGIDSPVGGASISLSKGKYVIVAYAGFNFDSGNVRNTEVSIMKGSTRLSQQRISSDTSVYIGLNASLIYEVTNDNGETLKVAKSSSVAESSAANTTITAIRIA